ncbi:MAG TPA: hypothetical protein VFN18_11385 [Solirubrobacterales bacterium]|nr:hypothetical protein [Solirubrobacterales bacterium]
MKTRLSAAAVAAIMSIGLLSAATASAATEAGSGCEGNAPGGNLTIVGTANAPGNPLPAAIPVSGVITKWTYKVVPIPPNTFSATLKTYRRTGGANQFVGVAESGFVSLNPGQNTVSARIPVQAGDLIGWFGLQMGSPFTILCTTGSAEDKGAVFEGNPPLGSTVTALGEGSGIQAPVTVSVEPDADNDGFGDETQDQCPQSAAVQVSCPVVTLSTATQVRKGSVTVIVTSSTAAPVTVKGVASLGKGKKAKLNGGTQNLVAGTLGKFRLSFPKALKKKLKALPPKRSVRLNVTVTGTSVSGVVTTKTLKVKLKGQAKS